MIHLNVFKFKSKLDKIHIQYIGAMLPTFGWKSIWLLKTKNQKSKVKRPLNSKLNISKIEKALNIKLIDWKKDLRENLK